MSNNAFGKCIDMISSVIFDLYVKGKIDFSEFSLFGSHEPLNLEDDYFDILADFIASLSPEDYQDYMNQKKEESDLMWEVSLKENLNLVAYRVGGLY
ncbi:hypothetical protein [Brevibacillus laterosporus]|uniref:hypothetical protein n=1 Tax=Brevibacillus laterosporus TaxID=1465 RepID=UPI003D1EFD53